MSLEEFARKVRKESSVSRKDKCKVHLEEYARKVRREREALVGREN